MRINNLISSTTSSGKKRASSEAFDEKQREGKTRSISKINRAENDSESIRTLFSCRKLVKLNLPRLNIPELLPKKDEKAMLDLHMLLKEHGFDVHHRPTLAFFAIGAQRDVQAASQCFFEFFKLARRWEIRYPDRIRIDQIVKEGWVEGFARHYDGTYGALVNFGNWNADDNSASYVVRELFCYYLKNLDFTILKKGITVVGNLRNLVWRSFAPFEMIKVCNYLSRCIPLKKKLLFVAPSFYATIALTLSNIVKSLMKNELYILTLEEAHELYPDVLLPPSLTPLTKTNERFTQLSADEQINFQILID